MNAAKVKIEVVIAWIGALIIIPGCGCGDALYEATAANPEVRLPQDEAPHCYSAEWWYYTGLLVAEDHREYGVEAVVFQASPGEYVRSPDGQRFTSPIPGYVAHLAITDVAEATFHSSQSRSINLQPITLNGFHLVTPILTVRGNQGIDQIVGAMEDGEHAIDLQLVADADPILHGVNGYVPQGPTGHSFYYSRPRMQATGLLRDGDEVLSVTGNFWFDRQWGADLNFPFYQWDWFSIRLDDGSSIMIYQFNDAPDVEYGTIVRPNGDFKHLLPGDFVIEELSYWTSPSTGTTYPVQWRIQIPEENQSIEIDRVMDDQEIDARTSTLTVYWEGLCRVTGTRNNLDITGHAYVELANYHLATP